MPARSGDQSPAHRKVAQVRRQQRSRQLLMRALLTGAAVVVAAAVAAVGISLSGGRPKTVNAAVHGMATGGTVDGISCDSSEQVAYHIHAHLAIYVNGKAAVVPRGIGIPGPQQVQQNFVVGGKCFYWLHTHDTTGVIHIESPSQRTYTLGQFFDIWGQPLGGNRVATASGTVTTFVNGHRYSGDPRSIKLTPHEVIQLDVGAVVLPRHYTFPQGL